MKQEKLATYYDGIYKRGYDTSAYQPIYDRILIELRGSKDQKILEIGCGVGSLAKMFIEQGFDYRGFDYSLEAIVQAGSVCGNKVFKGNAYDKGVYGLDYDIVVAVEVLEHLDDLKVLSMVAEGKIVVLTLPNFDDPAHLRVYPSEEFIRERFGDYLLIHKVVTFAAGDGAKFFLVVGHRIKTIPANTLSVCMIVKDEEENLPRALKSVANVADEIIVVDTGSKDKTPEIAKRFGCKLFFEEWRDDFSYHRNNSIKLATGRWIMILDADEELEPKDVDGLKEAVATEKQCQGFVIQHISLYGSDSKSEVFLPQMRIFRNGMGFHYQRRWHNELMSPTGARLKRLACRINHYGYDLPPEENAIKQARLEKMAEITLREDPEDPFQLYNAAEVLRSDGRHFRKDKAQEIIELTRRSAMLSDPRNTPNWATHLMALNLCGWAYFYKGDALQATAYGHRAVSLKPDYLDAIFLLALSYKATGAVSRAIQWCNEYLARQAKYNQLEERDPIPIRHLNNRPDIYLALAGIYEPEDEQKARSNYLMALKTRPGNKYSLEYLDKQELTEQEKGFVEKFKNKSEEPSGKHSEEVRN